MLFINVHTPPIYIIANLNIIYVDGCLLYFCLLVHFQGVYLQACQ